MLKVKYDFSGLPYEQGLGKFSSLGIRIGGKMLRLIELLSTSY